MTITLEGARAIARRAHHGQTDLLGVDYMEHVEAVAAGLVDFDLDLQVAAMLHDVVEDSDLTLDDLRDAGVSERSLAAVALVLRTCIPTSATPRPSSWSRSRRTPYWSRSLTTPTTHFPQRVEALRALGKEPKPRYAEPRRVLYAAAEA